MIGLTARALLYAGFLLALPVFDFEVARHSVHHLGSADNGCLLASAASNVSGVAPHRILVADITPSLIGAVPGLDIPRLLALPAVHNPGRAPPAPAFA